MGTIVERFVASEAPERFELQCNYRSRESILRRKLSKIDNCSLILVIVWSLEIYHELVITQRSNFSKIRTLSFRTSELSSLSSHREIISQKFEHTIRTLRKKRDMAWDVIDAWNELAEKSMLTLRINNASKRSVIWERVTSISTRETRGTVFHVLVLSDWRHEFSRARVSEHWTRSFVSARRTDSHAHTYTHEGRQGGSLSISAIIETMTRGDATDALAFRTVGSRLDSTHL